MYLRARPAEKQDLPVIREMAARADFPSPDLESQNIEALWVIVDEQDRVMMAVAAERIIQLFMWSREFEHPASKLAAIRLMQDQGGVLKEYRDVVAFIEPSLARRFGRRLEQSLGWVRNWPSWSRKL